MGTIASVVLHWYETTRSPRGRNESFDIFESPRPPSDEDEDFRRETEAGLDPRDAISMVASRQRGMK